MPKRENTTRDIAINTTTSSHTNTHALLTPPWTEDADGDDGSAWPWPWPWPWSLSFRDLLPGIMRRNNHELDVNIRLNES
jgi:hypothetical protein